jgi:uncharacterized protein with GYD domain
MILDQQNWSRDSQDDLSGCLRKLGSKDNANVTFWKLPVVVQLESDSKSTWTALILTTKVRGLKKMNTYQDSQDRLFFEAVGLEDHGQIKGSLW